MNKHVLHILLNKLDDLVFQFVEITPEERQYCLDNELVEEGRRFDAPSLAYHIVPGREVHIDDIFPNEAPLRLTRKGKELRDSYLYNKWIEYSQHV